MTRYESAKEIYAKLGVDTDAAIAKCKEIPVSLHCWQGDDVTGFDHDGPLTGGIQTTGNYPGKARTPEELLADMDKAMSLMPGKKKINVHACYAIFEDGEFVDRDKLEPKHFQKWVDFAKERGMGLDFNPTFFSHPMVKDGLTLSSSDEEVRNFWIEHGKACIRISQYFAEQTGVPCVMNIWTGDGFKDIPADRMGPRVRYKESIDAILSEPFDTNLVKPCVESKVFGIGVEAYTVGSAEFSLSYAAMNKDKCLPLMDNGHYHPTEVVSDKIPALLTFFPEIALHVTRPIRWDSDHVVLFDDETKEIAKEIVRCENGIDRTYIALDYFDASINRISAWVTGFRSFQKALLDALCQPSEMLKELQDTNQMSKKMVVMEQCKTLPIGDVWEEYCRQVRPGLCKSAGLKLVYSPLNGSGLVPVTRVLKDIGITDVTIVPEQEYPNGYFTTCSYPNPEIFAALELGLNLAKETGADLMLATDPDADRVGIAMKCPDGSYELVSGNEVGVLLLDYIAAGRIEKGTMPEKPVAVKSLVSTPLADAVAEHYGVELRNVLTGFKWIGDQIANLEAAGEVDRFIFGFEESYGYLAGPYVRDKDAIIGSMLICEMAAYYRSIGSSLKQRLEEIYAQYGRYLNKIDSFEFPGLSGMDKMSGIMEDLRKNPLEEIAGYKVASVIDYEKTEETGLPKANVLVYKLENNETVIVRPSGTEPKIKIYYTTLGKDLAEAEAEKEKLAEALKPIME